MSFSPKKTIKYVIALFVIVFALLTLWYGSILPAQKARSYIEHAQELRTSKDIASFMQTLNGALMPYAPLGQDEVVKFMGNDLALIVSSPEQHEAVARMVVNYFEPLVNPTNPRHLFLAGSMRKSLWVNTGNAADFRKAERHFLNMHRIGPKLPQPLYDLLEMYTAVGATENAIRVAENIVQLWPEDESTKQTLRQLQAAQKN